MSRTKRRTNRKPPKWVTHKLLWQDKCPIWRPLFGTELAKSINKYHADTGVGYGWAGHAPASFRRDCNREFRAKMKHETRRILKQGDYWDYEFKPFKKDAGWLYW